MITLADQIACARRELEMRRNVYPRHVMRGRMTRQKADDEIALMRAIVATLEELNRPKIGDLFAARKDDRP